MDKYTKPDLDVIAVESEASMLALSGKYVEYNDNPLGDEEEYDR